MSNTARSSKSSGNSRSKTVAVTIVCLFILLVLFSIVLLISNESGADETSSSNEAGVAFLTSRESQDVNAIEQVFRDARRQERVRQYEAGEIDVWTLYNKDAVILGDSRAAGFTWVPELDTDVVCAAVSNTIYNINDHYDYIQQKNPSMIFITYGMNDIGIWNGDFEQWSSELSERIETLKSIAPNATIYMISIFPVLSSSPDYNAIWDDIPTWNSYIQEYCGQNGLTYIDLTYVAEQHQDLYAEDGIHFATEFYTYWGEEMISYAG